MYAIDRTVYRPQYRKVKLQQLAVIVSIGIFLIIFLCMVFSLNTNKTINTDYQYEPITVQKGDTLWSLAARHNHVTDINVLVNKTIKYNNLSSTYIQPGQVLYIPIRS